MGYLTNILKNIEFSVDIPEGYQYCFSPGIFHQPKHISLQGKEHLSFFILNTHKKHILGHIFFHLSALNAFSPLKASYGGIEFKPNLDLKVLWEFENYFASVLKDKKIISVNITLPPALYNLTTHTKQFVTFQNKGYQVQKVEPGASIPITRRRFESALDNESLRKMKLAHMEGLAFHNEGNELLERYYNFIREARRKKEQRLSMTLDQLKNTAGLFENNFLLFGMYQDTRLVSAAITIKVTDKILYNFYSAHDEEFNFCSPVVVLFENIYNYCRDCGIKLFDLGTSSLEAEPNFSLLHFKEHLGAVLSPKITFAKKIS